MPADGPCLIVTRPRDQAAEWVRVLNGWGLKAEALPLIDIGSAPDPAAVQRSWGQLPDLHFVMFVSANAVEQFFELRPAKADWPSGLSAGSTGQGTSAALRARGVPQMLIEQPAPGDPSESEALWRQIAHWPWTGRRVLVVRGEEGRDWLSEQFRQAGASVAFVAAYRRRPPTWTPEQNRLLQQALAAPAAHLWLFSSSEAVRHLRSLVPGATWSGSRALATHPRIAEAAREAGFAQVLIVEPSLEAVKVCCGHLEFRAP
ncbi:MAG: uroporphyrinogen-III synthase [Rubrivivax sp.]